MQARSRSLLRRSGRSASVGFIAVFCAVALLSGAALASGFIAPRNSVRTRSIRNGAVTTPKIALGAVGTAQLATNAVSTVNIAPGAVDSVAMGADSVTGSNVVDNSLTGDDIDESTLGTVPSATVAGNEVSTFHDASVTDTSASTGFFDVLTLSSIPAGSYVIFAKGIVENAAASAFTFDCQINAGGNSDATEVHVPSLDLGGFNVMVVHDFTTAGSATLQCNNPSATASDVSVETSKIIAIPVMQLNDAAS